ncbi:hypothetical protein BST43_22135 [Mycobacteroides saopaulense]|uniref:Uncharacterized protein n=1 Tax=Mycobacteroides saopaulense TaxID=1578165 RepID=A0A1X0IRK0_9MYCO|nr:hypothetical protein BST43_22135 [Mycobacteroides saopaulense]
MLTRVAGDGLVAHSLVVALLSLRFGPYMHNLGLVVVLRLLLTDRIDHSGTLQRLGALSLGRLLGPSCLDLTLIGGWRGALRHLGRLTRTIIGCADHSVGVSAIEVLVVPDLLA